MDDLLSLNPRRILGTRLGYTSRKWRAVVDECLKPFGLTDATWLPLLHISRLASSPRQKDLAEAIGIDDSSLVRLIDTLVRHELVERETDVDRRAKIIVLTKHGREMVEKVEGITAEIRRKLLIGISDVDLEVTVKVMEQICAALGSIAQAEKGN